LRRSKGYVVAEVAEAAAIAALLVERGLAADAGDVDLELLAGGYRNRVYRWRRPRPAPDAVVKVFVESPENPLFPTLADHEAAALSLLAGSGLAPEPIAAASDPHLGDVLVYAMVEGDMWATDTRAVGRLLRRVHAVDPASSGFAFRTLVSSPDDLAIQTVAMLERADDDPLVQRVRALTERARAGAANAAGPACLVHTDPGPGNVIVAADGPRLIDWQCPGLGDPVEDLAGFASPAIHILYGLDPLGPDDVADLLDGYDELSLGNDSARSATARFAALAPLFSARLAAYCAYRTSALAHSEPHVSARYRRALHAEIEHLKG
jgi:thiamine kinase